MATYIVPGVFVEVMKRGLNPIEGIATGTAGFLGAAVRGPVRPVFVTSEAEYFRWFGGPLAGESYLQEAVRGFFVNGGRRLYVARIASLTATYAHAPVGPHFTLRAVGPGSWGRRIYAVVSDSTTRTNGGAAPIGLRVRLAYYDAAPAGNPLDWFNGVPGAVVPDVFEDFDDLVVGDDSTEWWRHWLDRSTLASLERASVAPAGVRPTAGFCSLAHEGLDVLTTLQPDQSASLVARGINFIATFKDRGVRLWGTRTLSSHPAWKYVSVRRLDLYIERSIDAGLRWTVFELNAAPLWHSVRASVEDFLLNLWQRGALLGSTPYEAFFVKCDRTTMTTDDVINGRLIVVVGVAHLRPAEFVIRKFQFLTSR